MSLGQHTYHEIALRWYKSIGPGKLLFCRFTMLGYIRLLTNQQVMGDNIFSLEAALEMYDMWMRDARVEIAPEPRGADRGFRIAVGLIGHQPATKAINDCYLVGFAEAADAQIVTFDKGLAKTAGFLKVPVTLLRPPSVAHEQSTAHSLPGAR